MDKEKTTIPKIIHYCWFGGNPLPDNVKNCISTWKKFCPDYKIIEWNEENFDVNSNTYIKEAYESKKWAFITDYVRLYVLTKYGGVYMDTDVEVLKNLDRFLVHNAFSGFESSKTIPTGIMGCRKGFHLFLELLHYYDGKHFINKDGTLDTTTNVETITKLCKKHGFVENGMKQSIEGFVLYPSDFFCPKDYKTGIIKTTNNTYTIHHFSGSWKSDKKKKLNKLQNNIYKKFGSKFGNIIYNTIFLPYRLKIEIQESSLKSVAAKIKRKAKK